VCHYIIVLHPAVQTKRSPLHCRPPLLAVHLAHRLLQLHVVKITAAFLIRAVLRIDKAFAVRSAHLHVTHATACGHI